MEYMLWWCGYKNDAEKLDTISFYDNTHCHESRTKQTPALSRSSSTFYMYTCLKRFRKHWTNLLLFALFLILFRFIFILYFIAFYGTNSIVIGADNGQPIKLKTKFYNLFFTFLSTRI